MSGVTLGKKKMIFPPLVLFSLSHAGRIDITQMFVGDAREAF